MSETIVDDIEEVAAHFKKSVRQIRNWRKEGMPILSGGRFDLVQIEGWRSQRRGGRGPAAADERQPPLVQERDKDYQDMRAKRAMADLREMEFRQRRGQLLERQEVKQLFIARILAVKQGLLNLARALPPQLIHCQTEREMEIIIRGLVRELLEDFARPLPGNVGGAEDPAAKREMGVIVEGLVRQLMEDHQAGEEGARKNQFIKNEEKPPGPGVDPGGSRPAGGEGPDPGGAAPAPADPGEGPARREDLDDRQNLS